jgi:sugar/nucleoside kinase (ribokinase family)
VVLIGHVGFATNRTANGTRTSLGGAGYATAVAASALLNGGVGLVAQVGQDFDLAALSRLGLDMAGVAALPGASARFYIRQLDDGTRSFRSELGVAATPRLDLFPAPYFRAKYVHLGEEAVLAYMVFLNQDEYNGLYDENCHPKAPTILKRGPGGADFVADGMSRRVSALPVGEIDPIGAGEVLAGAFLALRARGLQEIEALSHAVCAATSSVRESGVDGPELAKTLALIQGQLPAATSLPG